MSHGKSTAVGHQRINMQMVQNVLLIWLDNDIDGNSVDCRNTLTQLRPIVNTIDIFTDCDQCVDFLTDISNEKVCMIISDATCRNTVPLIHDIDHVHSIFIFCTNKTRHEQWAKDWPKIKGVFTVISSICEALTQAVQQCEQNAIPISFMNTNDDLSKKNLDQLDASFMYTQIFKEILLTIKFEQHHIKEFLDYCREQFSENNRELNNIKKLETKYRDETPIWWYTYECFLYPMLNRALRLMDVDILIKMGFFINDLHHHIEQLHSEQFHGQNSDKSFTVYRGQGMSKTDFEQLKKTMGGLISFNNFLSTSKNRDVSLKFARRALPNQDMMGILFVMTIDPAKSTTPFASITDVSFYKDREDEVLFSMHTVFRICNIQLIGGDKRLIQVDLTLTSDNDKDLRRLTDRIREETMPDAKGWFRLGVVLIKMGQSSKAQKVYEILLKQTTEESEEAPIYNTLGAIKRGQGEYKEAITYFEKSLKIQQKILHPNHPELTKSYNNIGLVYENIGEHSKALSYYETALEIQQQSLPLNQPDLAIFYNNIGLAYDSMGEYPKALSYYEKALEIRQQSLPWNHPDLAASHNNIGSLHGQMGKHATALLSLEKALEIQQQFLPPNHPNLAKCYSNIGSLHAQMEQHAKALSYFEKAGEVFEKTLPWNHPHLAMSYSNIGSVYFTMGNYSKARAFYERAVQTGQQSLPPNHPHLQEYRKNLDIVKKKL